MVAPAAPVIDFRTGGIAAYRIRWPSVSTAATYKVYVNAVATGQVVTDDVSGKNQATVICATGDSITVTAVNAGAEESAASNAIVVGGMGGATSYPPQGPRGPYYSNPVG